MQPVNRDRRLVLKGGLVAGSLFLPAPYAWVWAQSEGAVSLLKAPKLALVVGNGAYKNLPPLKNPANDAKAIAATLTALKFNVTQLVDASRRDMEAAMRDYAQTLEASKCVGLFYFAGHGLQLAWHNYLLPVDASVDNPDEVKKTCVDVDGLVTRLRKSANPMNVIILDACRENPFADDFRAGAKGLSQMDAPQSTLLAYATSPGNVAADGAGANGLYTEHLLREMQVADAKIEDVFKRVRLGVRLKSNGSQIPWESTSLEEDFWFRPPDHLQKLTEEESQRQFRDELALWEKIRAAKDPAPFEDYLGRYPSGKFCELAQLQLDRALAGRGEKKINIASAAGNPFSKGSATANTAYKIGDSYNYRMADLQTRAEKRQTTAIVERITDNEVVFQNGLVTDLLGNTVTAADGRRYSPRQQLPLEYAVGRRWHSRFTATTRKGDDEGIADMQLKIVARERIAVPAGSFDAFRIEAVGTTTFKTQVTETQWRRWMAPDQVRRAVAFEEILKAGSKTLIAERGELVSFKQA
ncbi:MAG: caspase family protein [Pseudomonadota bacterium]